MHETYGFRGFCVSAGLTCGMGCVMISASDMARHLVNLDAMIPRGDFESGPDPSDVGVGPSDFSITLAELEKGKIAFSVLRKPDF